MRTIAIILGDNDFHHTFQPLLQSIYQVVQWHSNELSKETIEKCIREGIKYHYLAFQYGDKTYHTNKDLEFLMNTYFKDIKVLFDEEAEKAIQEEDHDGGAWYLELTTGNVYCF